MSGVTDVDDQSAGGGPFRLRVSPEKLKVDNCVGRCELDQVLEDRRPGLEAYTLVYVGEDFVGRDGV